MRVDFFSIISAMEYSHQGYITLLGLETDPMHRIMDVANVVAHPCCWLNRVHRNNLHNNL